MANKGHHPSIPIILALQSYHLRRVPLACPRGPKSPTAFIAANVRAKTLKFQNGHRQRRCAPCSTGMLRYRHRSQVSGISKRFKRIIDKELALDNADFSTLTFRHRRNITDSAMTPKFAHIFRRASIVYLNGTGIGHYGAMKLVTDYTKELHIERCPRVDVGQLIQAIAGDRWLSYDLDPVRVYIKRREARGSHDYRTIIKPLSEYSWAVVVMSNECCCQYVKVEEYQGAKPDVVPCHVCDKDVKKFTMDVSCNGCGSVTCTDCQTKVCGAPTCKAVFCKGCATEVKCSLCHKEWCGWCRNVGVFQCYGCEANVCDECEPSRLKCSLEQYREYCAQCAGAMVDKHGHWCCDAGEFSIEPMR